MKKLSLIAMFAVAMTAASPGRDISPFKDFEGSFSNHARVKISGGNGVAASGRINQRFSIGKGGQSARLKIQGTIKLEGAIRPLSLVYFFRSLNEEGIRRAAMSNLAPGIDDGYVAEEGTYSLTARTIRAEIPFVFGTTQGLATVYLRFKQRPRTTELVVTHTLISNTLTRPIIWTFDGRTHP